MMVDVVNARERHRDIIDYADWGLSADYADYADFNTQPKKADSGLGDRVGHSAGSGLKVVDDVERPSSTE
jgi:hypothetical protein